MTLFEMVGLNQKPQKIAFPILPWDSRNGVLSINKITTYQGQILLLFNKI